MMLSLKYFPYLIIFLDFDLPGDRLNRNDHLNRFNWGHYRCGYG
ncbi:hypothetical protein PROAA_1450021 [Candidatus Propionivibrio aalborgensis]|uniref:Uncharacterized protein n=1 Tax=Candidatus Propionivibrio aalborgensis TaxID=1860101 RepID=A0A1A8XMM8_9RHOO|nr:hypothetical protein PROAA_1450021 [Candidatus Propionivibrio aalborgensis]